jgi:hypothetical protein
VALADFHDFPHIGLRSIEGNVRDATIQHKAVANFCILNYVQKVFFYHCITVRNEEYREN